jgi:hypothetical protein
MPANSRAEKSEKNKKTTDDAIVGKEKSKDRRESSLPPKQSEPSASGKTISKDTNKKG